MLKSQSSFPSLEMTGFFDCGFTRVAVKKSFKKENGNPEMDKSKRMSSYLLFFGGKNEDNFRVTQKIFNFKSVSLVNCSNKWNIVEEKKKILGTLLQQSLEQPSCRAESVSLCE